MNIIAPIILLMGISNILGTQYLLPTKKQKEYTISVLTGVVVNFILNYIMIHLWQAVGACIASVISQVVVDAMQWHYVKNEIDLKGMIKISYKYLFSAIIMFVCCKIVQMLLSGFMCFVVQIIVGIVVYMGILIITKDEFVYLVLNGIRNKIVGVLSREK